MADIGFEIEYPSCGSLSVYKWPNITESDAPQALFLGGKSTLSIQALGDFGTGGEVGLEASNVSSGEFFNPVTSLATFSDEGVSKVEETYLRIRPAITAGTSVSVSVYLMVNN